VILQHFGQSIHPQVTPRASKGETRACSYVSERDSSRLGSTKASEHT